MGAQCEAIAIRRTMLNTVGRLQIYCELYVRIVFRNKCQIGIPVLVACQLNRIPNSLRKGEELGKKMQLQHL